MARTAQQLFTRGVTAKMSMNFNANNVLHYGTQLSKVSPGIQTCTVAIGSRILGTVLEMAMTALDLAPVPLITSTIGFSKPEPGTTNTSATSVFVTAYLPPGDAESSDVTVNEDRKMRVPALVTPHAEYSSPRALNRLTSGQTLHSVDKKPLTSVMPPTWGTLPPSLVFMTTVMDSHSSGSCRILNADSESNLDPVSTPEVVTSASTWTNKALLSAAGISIPSVKTSVQMEIREFAPSTFPLEKEYCAPYSVVSNLQNKIHTNKQPLSSTPSANYTYASYSQNISNLPFAEKNNFSELDVDAFVLKTFPVQYSSLATALTMSDPLQKEHGSMAENIADFFTVGDVPMNIHNKAPLHLHVPPVSAAGVLPSSLESQTSDAGNDWNVRHMCWLFSSLTT